MKQEKKFTILIIAPNFLEPTAWMISAYKTALNLAKHKDVKVVVLTSNTKGSRKYEIMGDVEVYRSKAVYIPDPFNYAFTPFIFRDLKRLIRKFDPDVFLVNKYMFFPNLTAIQLKLMKKEYYLQTDTFPGYNWFAPSKVLNFFMWIYTRTIGLMILRMAKKIIILHEGLIKAANDLKLNYEVLHNGVDLDKFADAKPAADITEFKGDSLLVTYLGRLDEVKGYRNVLKAAETIHSKHGDMIKFLFVCGDKYTEMRKRLERRYPYIMFTGFRSDIPQIFRASDIHVLASYTEGLPNSVLEAMASECAVISTPVGAVPYFIEDGKNGLIIEKDDAYQIAEAVEKLSNDHEMLIKISEFGFATVRDKFNWQHLSEKMLKIFGEK